MGTEIVVNLKSHIWEKGSQQTLRKEEIVLGMTRAHPKVAHPTHKQQTNVTDYKLNPE